MHKVGIIATFGPSLFDYSKLEEAIRNGADIIRFNFSHANTEIFDKAIEYILRLKEKGMNVKIMADLKGNRIRVRNIKEPLSLTNQSYFIITSKDVSSTEGVISIDYKYSLNQLKKGNKIYIDDGNIELEVMDVISSDKLKAIVKRGGILKDRKGINIPGVNLYFPDISEEDKTDLNYIVERKFDMLALSFVRNSIEIKKIKEFIKEKKSNIPAIISKIENTQALRNITSIIKNSSGIMVARGDLGISVPLYKIPVIQKRLIKEARKYNKFSIVATQIFESMVEHYRPTRAEISDLANAIEDGTDFVMFSAETSVGKYPIETIKIAKEVIKYTLRYLKWNS